MFRLRGAAVGERDGSFLGRKRDDCDHSCLGGERNTFLLLSCLENPLLGRWQEHVLIFWQEFDVVVQPYHPLSGQLHAAPPRGAEEGAGGG